MKQIQANSLTALPLGRQGENLARQIVFDIREWESLYGPGAAELVCQRPDDPVPYPVAVKREGSLVLWNITARDTARTGGYGRCELRYLVGEVVAKSRVWKTWAEPAMEPAGEAPPEPQQSWVDQVLEAGAQAVRAAERAELSAVRQPYPNGGTETWWVWDPDAGAYRDSGQPSVGEVSAHSRLTGRDAENQHPISAITQLANELNSRLTTSSTITALDIIKMMEE